mmetsp:Transcript_45651/g.73060  ORF Transcript_45651/g.73060 Transcript_45651/m.73060 type:complete len:202 (-) Transcript_45651:1046-1651(-)
METFARCLMDICRARNSDQVAVAVAVAAAVDADAGVDIAALHEGNLPEYQSPRLSMANSGVHGHDHASRHAVVAAPAHCLPCIGKIALPHSGVLPLAGIYQMQLRRRSCCCRCRWHEHRRGIVIWIKHGCCSCVVAVPSALPGAPLAADCGCVGDCRHGCHWILNSSQMAVSEFASMDCAAHRRQVTQHQMLTDQVCRASR